MSVNYCKFTKEFWKWRTRNKTMQSSKDKKKHKSCSTKAIFPSKWPMIILTKTRYTKKNCQIWNLSLSKQRTKIETLRPHSKGVFLIFKIESLRDKIINKMTSKTSLLNSKKWNSTRTWQHRQKHFWKAKSFFLQSIVQIPRIRN